MFCQNCGYEIKDGVKFCSSCGQSVEIDDEKQESLESSKNDEVISENDKFCVSCGEKIKKETEICLKCGVRQMPAVVDKEKSLLVTMLLACFLGFCGGHNFYIKKKIKFILSIVLAWTFVPAILSYIDVMIMSKKSIAELNNKYGVKFIDFEKDGKRVFNIVSIVLIILSGSSAIFWIIYFIVMIVIMFLALL